MITMSLWVLIITIVLMNTLIMGVMPINYTTNIKSRSERDLRKCCSDITSSHSNNTDCNHTYSK